MGDPKTPEATESGQYRLPDSKRGTEPTKWVDPVQKRLNEQIENGFKRTAEDFDISVEDVRMVQNALGQSSWRAFEHIRNGMSPTEAIAAAQREKQTP